MVNLDNILLIRLTNTKPDSIVDVYTELLEKNKIPNDPTYLPEHITLEYTVGRITQDILKVNCYKYAYIIPLSSVTKNLYSISPNANILMQTTLKENTYILCPNEEVKDLEVKFGYFYRGTIIGYNHDKNMQCGGRLQKSDMITEQPKPELQNTQQPKPELQNTERPKTDTSDIIIDVKKSELSLHESINKILSAVQGDLIFTLEGSKLHIGLKENPIPIIDILPKDRNGNRFYKDNRIFIDKYEKFVQDVNACINYDSKDRGAQDNIKKYCSTRNTFTPVAKNVDERALTLDQNLPVFTNSFLYISMSLSTEIRIMLKTRAIEPVLREFLDNIANAIRYSGIVAEFYGKYYEFNYNFMYNPKTDSDNPISVRRTLLNIRKSNPSIRQIERELYEYANSYEEGISSNDLIEKFNVKYNQYKVELSKIYDVFASKGGLHKFE